MTLLIVLYGVIELSCASAESFTADTKDDTTPLPDLIIKRVTFQIRTTGFRLVPQRANVILVPCDFRIQVDNIGNVPFDKPFYISVTTSVTDYQNYIYSKHELVNEAGASIAPKRSYTFVISEEIEIPRSTAFQMRFPMRFYINTEGALNARGYQAPKIEERNYTNNTFELSLKIPRRQ